MQNWQDNPSPGSTTNEQHPFAEEVALRAIVEGVEAERGYLAPGALLRNTLPHSSPPVARAGAEKKVRTRLTDQETEADEMFQNAGEKGAPQRDAADPPRRRANKRKGLGTMPNDRPPIQGVVGRTSGQIRLTVCENTQQHTIQPKVEHATRKTAAVYTDESPAYNHLAETGCPHHSVCHSHGEYARDDDGDGIREVHCNTRKGIWTGLRNFLRPFRGVHKTYLNRTT
jgi:transposase-like protein